MAFDLTLLKQVPMFNLFDDDELRELAHHIEERGFVAGQTVFRDGDPGGEMHVVMSGKVELFISDPKGNRVSVGVVEAGEMFGELSLLDGEARSASAIAQEATRTCVVDRDDLTLLFSKKPQSALDILATIARRLRRADAMLAENMAQNANEVIAEKLTVGDRIADAVARFGGSWTFINLFLFVLLAWMALNTWEFLGIGGFDPPPFIGLNLVLSMLAAFQAPVIMMSQNRQDAKDRVRADIEYEVNVRAEVEVMELHQKVDRMKEEIIDLLVAVKNARV
jgi:CRP/FNR family cyclic AMP-dependent transcriptional regulator